METVSPRGIGRIIFLIIQSRKLGQLSKYFILCFVFSWTCFISVALISRTSSAASPELKAVQYILGLLGTIAPSLVALWLTSRTGVPGQTEKLLGKVVKWDVNIKWYFFAASFMLVVKLSVAALYKLITGAWPVFGQETLLIMLVAILISTWVQAGEEIGWRGFALPRMSAKFGLPVSTLLLGVIWAVWHLPLFFVKGSSTFGQSFPLFFVQVTMMSVVLGWLYWRTGGSLLLTMIMHAAINNTKDIVPSSVPGATEVFALSNSLVGWLTAGLIFVFATYCLVSMRSVRQLE